MAHSAFKTPLSKLRSQFGDRLQENVRLAHYTTAHVGGPADAMLIVNSAAEMEDTARRLWDMNVPFYLLGSGSNVLVSDRGFRGVILLNHAHNIKFEAHHLPPTVWAESGANIGTIARMASLRGFSGMEWAATVPGTLGGAVFGNAGAMGGDTSKNLIVAEILHRELGRVDWNAEQMGYAYRTSVLKREPGKAIILAARLQLETSTTEAVKAKMSEFSERRRSTQPPGASMGSMFKNPSGDYAGRLIEAAGLKGTRIGGAEISPIHANFFINTQEASASDIYGLIQLARQKVFETAGVKLELEVELLGEWEETTAHTGTETGREA